MKHLLIKASVSVSAKIISLSLLFLLSVFLSAVFSEIYTWKDKDGNVFFSDSPPAGVDFQKKKIREDRIERPEIKIDFPLKESSTAKEKRSYGDINVIMYMTRWCPHCRSAREHIKSLGAGLIEYDIDKEKEKEKEMLQKSGGAKGVPLIDVEGIIIRGFNPAAINEAVEDRRSSYN